MQRIWTLAATAALMGGLAASAQQPAQPQLNIDAANRTLTVTAEGRADMDPDLAVLHIGFETQPEDAKSAYADGARTSNAIIDAVKAEGVPQTAIHSESQRLSRQWDKPHKFTLVQQWTVRVAPERAAEILDAAITAGANSSGDIDWTVKDEKALEAKALENAAEHAKENAAVLARGMGVTLGRLIYVSNQVSAPMIRPRVFAMAKAAAPEAQPLAIAPDKVSREATVYAVYAIE